MSNVNKYIEPCANDWNSLTVEQQCEYQYIRNFVNEWCSKHNVQLNDNDLYRLTDYVGCRDKKSYERWSLLKLKEALDNEK